MSNKTTTIFNAFGEMEYTINEFGNTATIYNKYGESVGYAVHNDPGDSFNTTFTTEYDYIETPGLNIAGTHKKNDWEW